MAWATVTSPTTATPVATSTFGTPVAGNMAIIGGAWTSYTPTLTNITLNNGTILAAYKQIDKTVHVRFLIAAGSTTTYAAGALAVSLPVTPHADYTSATANGTWSVGPAMTNISGTRQGATACISTAGVVNFVLDSATTGTTVTNLIPGTWTTTSKLGAEITYEAA